MSGETVARLIVGLFALVAVLMGLQFSSLRPTRINESCAAMFYGLALGCILIEIFGM